MIREVIACFRIDASVSSSTLQLEEKKMSEFGKMERLEIFVRQISLSIRELWRS